MIIDVNCVCSAESIIEQNVSPLCLVNKCKMKDEVKPR